MTMFPGIEFAVYDEHYENVNEFEEVEVVKLTVLRTPKSPETST